MYAVIQTGGKQYRVQAGDVLVVEKLAGEPGVEVAFDKVLMLGGEGGVTVGAPLVEGAVVTATLIETRKGAKIKVFKKIRRQGYRRTNGHRQPETVLRVTGLTGAGQSAKWDGTVDLTPRSELVARARGLARRDGLAAGSVEVEPFFEPAGAELDEVQTAKLAQELAAETPAKKPRAKKAAGTDAMVEQPVGETPAEGPQTSVDADAAQETGSMAAEEAPKKPRAKKAKPASDDAGSAE